MPPAVATSASDTPLATTGKPMPPAAAMSRNARMMPMTVPSRPTNGAIAPIVPSAHRRRRIHRPSRWRSRSAALCTDSPGVESLEIAASITSATGESLRSQSARAPPRSPRYRAFVVSAPSARAFSTRPR
jgi:hypothetical protein